MELAYRVVGPVGDRPARSDLLVRCDDSATVGQVADAVSAHLALPPGSTLRVRWPVASGPLPRGASVRSCGPRSGSTVELCDGSDPVCGPARSPVTLVDGEGGVRLPAGRTVLGAAEVEVGDAVEVRGDGTGAVRVNGRPVHDTATVGDGDVVHDGTRARLVVVDGPLVGPPGPAPRAVRPTGIPPPYTPARRVELPAPPEHVRTPGLPVVAAAVPLLMGAGLWIATRSLMSVAFVAFSVVFVLASGWESRREARAEDRDRVARFREALAADLSRVDRDDRVCRSVLDDAVPGAATWLARLRADPTGVPRGLWEAPPAPPGSTRNEHGEEPSGAQAEGPAALMGSVAVRLGAGPGTTSHALVVPEAGRVELLDELRAAVAVRSSAEGPVVVDLVQLGGLAVVGPDLGRAAVTRALVCQVACSHPPTAVALDVLAGPGRRAGWQWADWLPHRSAGSAPSVLLVADGADDEALGAALARHRARSREVLVLWAGDTAAGRPRGLGAHVELSGDASSAATVLGASDSPRPEPLRADALGSDDAEALARLLAGHRHLEPVALHARAGGARPGDATPPRRVDLVRLLGPDALDATVIGARWCAGGTRGPAAPVGLGPRRGPVGVDLGADGPHALVAGTTGAGKSELLRTLLVSLALHHPPERLTFLLVDYKGGAAFGPLASLPHSVGLVTDLHGGLAERVLVSLGAEVRRREAILGDATVDDAAAARSAEVRIPDLLVVVDEFATLATEVPGFVEGLVDLARRGRSLGIHLVLATQRPAGVVTDQIRANTSLRLCLRVAEPEDSSDVVDLPDAAFLPRDAPGRAVMRVGPAETCVLQVAHTGVAVDDGRGAPTVSALHPRVRPDPGAPAAGPDPTPGPGAPTQLDAAVDAVRSAAASSGRADPRRPWLPELPRRIPLERVRAETGARSATTPGSLVVGVVDRPELQMREPLVLDLAAHGSVAVIGAGGSGRSTALRTIVTAMARDTTRWEVHAVGTGDGLAEPEARCAVASVIGVLDPECTLRMLRWVTAELEHRLDGPRDPAAARLVVVVDGIAAFEEVHERLDRGSAVAMLARIARDGRALGCHVVVTATRRAEIPPELAAALPATLHLRARSADDAALAGLPESWADAGVAPGRCRIGPHVAQLALPDGARGSPATTPPGPPALRRVRPLPSRVRVEDLGVRACPPGPARCDDRRWDLPLALDADSLEPLTWDLRRDHGLVAGPPGSGRTTTLRTLAAVARRHDPTLQVLWCGSPEALAELGADSRSTASEGPPALVLVDDVHLAEDDPDAMAALDRLVRRVDGAGVRVVVAGETDPLLRCFERPVQALRSRGHAVLLGGDADRAGALVAAELPRRPELRSRPGLAWVVSRGSARLAQLARADLDEHPALRATLRS